MITVKLTEEGLLDLPDETYVAFHFSRQGQGYVSELSSERFEEFLRAANLVTYKNNLKEYDDGDVVGEFSISHES